MVLPGLLLINKYKDNAQDNFRHLEETFKECKSENGLKKKATFKYEKTIEEYRERLKGYTHKDQKPFWH